MNSSQGMAVKEYTGGTALVFVCGHVPKVAVAQGPQWGEGESLRGMGTVVLRGC